MEIFIWLSLYFLCVYNLIQEPIDDLSPTSSIFSTCFIAVFATPLFFYYLFLVWIFYPLFITPLAFAAVLVVLMGLSAWLAFQFSWVLMRLFLTLLALILILCVFGLLFCTILQLGLIQILWKHLFPQITSFQSSYSKISQIEHSKNNYFISPIQLQD